MAFLIDKSLNIFKNNSIIALVFIFILFFTLLSSVYAIQYDNDTISDIDNGEETVSDNIHYKSLLSASKNIPSSNSSNINTSKSTIYRIYSNLSNDEIQTVFDNCQNGDTIQFMDRNYTNISLIVEKQLNIISKVNSVIYTTDVSNVRAASYGITDSFAFMFTNSSGGSVIKGLSFLGNSHYKIFINGADSITVNGNNIQQAKKAGIFVNNSLYNNISSNTVSNTNYGIRLNNTNRTVISNNKIYSCANTGLILKESSLNNITKNKIYRNGLDGIHLENGRLNRILNNIITNNKISGLRLEGFTARNTIQYNNISSNVINIYANSLTDSDSITHNTLMYAKAATNTYTTDDNTGSAIVFADNFTSVKAGIMSFAYNTVGFNEYWDAKSTMNHPSVDIGSNWYFDNDGNYAMGHICPMVFGGYLSPEDFKHLSMGFSKSGNGIIGQLFEGSNAAGAGAFSIDNVNIDGVDYGSVEVGSDGNFKIDLDNVQPGSKVTVTVNGHSFTVEIGEEKQDNSTEQTNTNTNEESENHKVKEQPKVTDSQKTSEGNGSGTGYKTGIGSGDGNFTGSGVAVGAESGESNSGTGVSGDNGGGSASEGFTAYEISKKISSTAAKNSQLLAVGAVVFVLLVIALGYRRKAKNNRYEDDGSYEL